MMKRLAMVCVAVAFSSALWASNKSPAAGSPASFAARGASEPVAACAAYAVKFVSTPGPIKKFSFEDDHLAKAKVEEWNAPFKAGEKDRVAQMVTLKSLGEPRTGNERQYEIKCGVNGTKVQGFSFRDVAVPIKTTS
jgi:hypothetical protein